MTPKFDNLAQRYLQEEGLKDIVKKLAATGALATGVATASPTPGYTHLSDKPEGLDLDAPQHQQYFTSTGEDEPEQKEGPEVHKIKSGDTLWDLAKKYKTSVRDIQKANPGIDPKKLQIGQLVNIPNLVKASEPTVGYDSNFIDYMKVVENGVKRGLKNGRWYPHKSAEGGKKTIAYGHKITSGEDYSKGITESEAQALLLKDLNAAKKDARDFLGSKKFDSLDKTRQEILIDYQFNLGTLKTFPKFVEAVIKNDKKGMIKHYQRKYRHPKTKKWLPIKDRNDRFKQRYLK